MRCIKVQNHDEIYLSFFMYLLFSLWVLFTSLWSQGKGPTVAKITALPWLHIGITWEVLKSPHQQF